MFNISRLITTPNPGTNSLPFGTCGVDVVGVVPLDVVGDGVAFAVGADAGVLVFADEAVGAAVVVSAVGAGEAGVLGASGGGGSANGGGSGAGAGCVTSWVADAFIGLTGFTGLLIFVTLVGLLTHVSCVTIQLLHTGSL